MLPIAGCCLCCTVHDRNEPSGCRAGTQDTNRYQGCEGWVCSGSISNTSHALADAVNPRVYSELFSQTNYKMLGCLWEGGEKKNSTTTPTTAAKFKYLLQSGLQQLRVCPHLFAPCRRISLRASAGCSWSSNHQLNPADKGGKSGYNHFLMSPKHHYHMKDTVTNGFTLCWLMETSAMRAMACYNDGSVPGREEREHSQNSGSSKGRTAELGAVQNSPH